MYREAPKWRIGAAFCTGVGILCVWNSKTNKQKKRKKPKKTKTKKSKTSFVCLLAKSPAPFGLLFFLFVCHLLLLLLLLLLLAFIPILPANSHEETSKHEVEKQMPHRCWRAHPAWIGVGVWISSCKRRVSKPDERKGGGKYEAKLIVPAS